MTVRRAAVAGSWYPAAAARLTSEIDALLRRADALAGGGPPDAASLVALIAPHAGLVYSGAVAAHAYRLLRNCACHVAVLLGPSHYEFFEGASVWPAGRFETPLGSLRVDEDTASALLETCPRMRDFPAAHEREHSIEMQLPFLAALAPDLPIVPIVMGDQTRRTAFAVADGLGQALKGRHALLIASSDLSHFFESRTAALLDAQVIDDVERFDADRLMSRLERRPEHACGGGPMVSVLRAAKMLGATRSCVLHYADSGDVSGDKTSVVGYLAGALWH